MKHGAWLAVLAVVSSAVVSSTWPARAQPPATPESGARQAAAAQRVTGRVVGYLTGPRGELNGLTLDNGVRVHFPPNAGFALLPIVRQGRVVRVTGRYAGPAVDVLEAATITDVAAGRTVNVSAMPAPPATPPYSFPRGAVPPPGQPPLGAGPSR